MNTDELRAALGDATAKLAKIAVENAELREEIHAHDCPCWTCEGYREDMAREVQDAAE